MTTYAPRPLDTPLPPEPEHQPTTTPVRLVTDVEPVPRLVRGTTDEQRFVQYAAWVAGLATAWLVTQRLLPLAGPAWLLVTWFLFGLVFVGVGTAMTGSMSEVADRIAAGVITGGALVVAGALLSTMIYVVGQGWEPLTHLNFLTRDMSGVGPRDPFTKGGILHAILGTIIQISIAIVITLPLGVGTAVFMTEVGGKYARVVRTIVEAMTALPSIVAGLFVYTVAIVTFGLGRSGLAAALALSVMMLPIIARAADVVLRVVPGGLREASLALGASRWRTVWHVVLPTARSGLATALILGVARGVGETSPVLLTSGAAAFTVINPNGGVMNSLPLYIFTTVRSGEPVAITRAFAAATVLLLLVLALFIAARVISRPPRARKSPPAQPRSKESA